MKSLCLLIGIFCVYVHFKGGRTVRFDEVVREEADGYWESSMVHPFVKGLVQGTLPMENFKFYMMQDAIYLKHYSKILAIAASKSETNQEVAYYLESARSINEAELELHRTVFKELHIGEQEQAELIPAPANNNYINHMYNAVLNESLPVAFAALLPCPWLYQSIGEEYKDEKPTQKLYRDWIELYSSKEFKDQLGIQKQMLNKYAKESPADHQKMKAFFQMSAYYECKFWDMAWSLENWKELSPYELA